ncbi:ABC-type transport auxiliary lipoprotein family protein [Methylocapsa polymorpha]|uniref:ABC-type transport auxiliary lipoprotein family protein n=1 Tax=Methylocapsa polymorpha TaxID=3080828 RepID=A0ABZ0HLS3_9HYPH|nr:ABC-type transport auxiliary lipoprotein family protein [Methylocapsa sp. RX1]
MEPGFALLLRASSRCAAGVRGQLLVVVIGIFAGLLAACATTPMVTYDLGAANGGGAARAGRGQLVVNEPTASLPTDSNRIVVRTGADAMAYLTGAQWPDKLPAVVQTRLIESFENAHLLRAVGRPGMLADYSLQTDIRRFELDVGHSEAVVEISARIIGSSGRILAGQIFSARVPASRDDGATVTAALNVASADVMRQIVLWAAPKV